MRNNCRSLIWCDKKQAWSAAADAVSKSKAFENIWKMQITKGQIFILSTWLSCSMQADSHLCVRYLSNVEILDNCCHVDRPQFSRCPDWQLFAGWVSVQCQIKEKELHAAENCSWAWRQNKQNYLSIDFDSIRIRDILRQKERCRRVFNFWHSSTKFFFYVHCA